MKNFFFFILTFCMMSNSSCGQKAQANATDVTQKPSTPAIDPAILTAIEGFIKGGDTRNVALLESVMHTEFRTTVNQFMGGDGVTVLGRDLYLGMIREGKFGGIPRTFQIVDSQSLGHTAHVQVHMESDELIFDNFINLVQDKAGKWQLLSDAATAKPKKG